MLSKEEVIVRVLSYNPNADANLLSRAYAVCLEGHAGQRRESGDPYAAHPVEVAAILTQLKLDVPSVAAGLLHDIVEDTNYSKDRLATEFGKDIAGLVDGVTKIGKIQFKNYEEKQAENFRKMIISMAEDIRVVLIKLADRLHNMRTLGYLPEHKQKRIAQETLEIYAPLANRLGIGWIKSEFEDLCLRYLRPEVYFSLAKKVAKKRDERQRYIEKAIELTKKNISQYGFKAEVLGRSKHLYSIYQKMERQGIPFEEVYDLMGTRIISDTKMTCYAILGMIHSIWRPVPGRFKDYIGVPKSNLYQSLHTTVVGPEGEHIEFQIRTQEMDKLAEEGIASHWIYKEGGKIDERDSRVFGWLRQLMEWQQELSDHRQFMDSVKTDLFDDVIYVFTPKGDVKELAKGGSPIDFAYAIHTEIGNRCSGAKVNGKIVPLRYQMRSGDTVEILTSPSQVPTKDWLKFVKTPKAKAKIKHFVKIEETKRALEIGRRMLEREARRERLSSVEVFKSEKILAAMKEQGIKTLDDLFAAVGYGRVSATQIIRPLVVGSDFKEGIKEKIVRKMGLQEEAVKVSGVNDIMIHLSKCCNPLPGDRIIGFITRGRGLSIHTVNCPNIDELDYDRDRLVEVTWDSAAKAVHAVDISVLTLDKPGLLALVSSSIASARANISHAEISTTEHKKAILNFVVDVTNTEHLERVLRNIEKVDGVFQARRIRKG